MTEVGLRFKSNFETFNLRQAVAGVGNFIVVHYLTPVNVQSVTSSNPSPGHNIWTVLIDNDSFIKFSGWAGGFSVQVRGKGNIFSECLPRKITEE